MTLSRDGVAMSNLAQFRLVDALSDATAAALITDLAQQVVYANPAILRTTGYSAAEMQGRNCRILQGEGTSAATVAEIRDALAARRPFDGVLLNYRKDGRPFWNSLSLFPLRGDAGTITHFAATLRDVTPQRTLEEQTRALLTDAERQRETSRMLLDVARALGQRSSVPEIAQAVADAVPLLCGADRSAVALWDQAAGRLTIAGQSGWGEPLADRVRNAALTPQQSPELAALLATKLPSLVNRQNASPETAASLQQFEVEAFAANPIRSDETVRGVVLAYWADASAPVELDGDLRDRLSGLAGLTAIALDNADLLAEARWNAAHDALTGLANRLLLEERLLQALLRSTATGTRVAVVYCDIDRFKRSNDSIGHSAGDTILREVASRLRAAVRADDTVARPAGDEFVIVLAGVDSAEEVNGVLDRLRSSLSEPLLVEGRKVFIGLSVGVALSAAPQPLDPPGRAEAPDAALRAAATDLIRRADAEMYRAKARGRGTAPLPTTAEDFRLDSDLRGAVERAELMVHYQPQRDLRTGRIVGAEALVRWRHPVLGTLLPERFVAIAEDNGTIHDIGRFVVGEACRAAAGWRASGMAIEVAFNVSAVQLTAGGFVDTVAACLAATGLPARSLIAEITESQVVAELPEVHRQLEELRRRGVGVSVDDFGTGFSSLAQLRSLPASEIKVDQGFVQQNGADGTALVRAIVGLGHGLGLRVIAEGVETAAQLRKVRELGCDRAQGYWISPPVPLPEFEALLTSSKSAPAARTLRTPSAP